MAPRAFISFEMEDRWARDFLVQHSKDDRNPVEFVDYSVQDPFDSSWKTNCKARIERTKGTIVMIGATTYQSDAVIWEIEETLRQGHHIFGIQVDSGKTHPIPRGITSSQTITWNFPDIASRLKTWV